MGGVPAAIGSGASAVGGGISNAAKSFFGAAKEGLNQNYIQPWKHAVSDMRSGQDPNTAEPTEEQQPQTNSAMQTFFNAPAQETPAMRLRRQAQQQG